MCSEKGPLKCVQNEKLYIKFKFSRATNKRSRSYCLDEEVTFVVLVSKEIYLKIASKRLSCRNKEPNMPVSYTHLDVYKRQPLIMLFSVPENISLAVV